MASDAAPSAAGSPVSDSTHGPESCTGAVEQMNSCWSCLVLLERNAVVCPICGADQTLPEVRVVLEPEKPRYTAFFVLRCATVTILVGCIVGALLWYSLREPGVDSPEQAEAIASKTLFDLRSDLLDYAIKSRDKYPSTLESLGGRTEMLVEAARNAGYQLEYAPQQSGTDGAIRGFILLARTEKANCRNFYIDQSSQVRATSENRPANLQDPTI